MHAAVTGRADEADAVVMAAAVADYTPAGGPRGQKIAKASETLTLTLTRTADVLRELGRRRGGGRRPVLIGFAAETRDVVARAPGQARGQGGRTSSSPTTCRGATPGSTWRRTPPRWSRQGGTTDLPLQSKRDLARAILDRLRDMLAGDEPPEAVEADHERP